MDPLKEAFQNVKEDMIYLDQKIDSLKLEIFNLKEELEYSLNSLKEITKDLKNLVDNSAKSIPAHNPVIPAHPIYSTDTSAHNYALNDLKGLNMISSTGNEGVPTDRQTHQQTDRQIDYRENPIESASKLLDSLDSLKKDIRLKFKRITDQELLIFSTIYQLEEERGKVEYKDVAIKLNLSESSIRDYVSKLIKKGIPVDKTKINNKTILLTISSNLKKIASLPTILQLRDL